MNPLLQGLLLKAYAVARRSDLLLNGPGAFIYESAYEYYKLFLEAGPVHQLQRFILPGQSVIDVGAHIGFFSARFAHWVSDGGRVIACEPEEENLLRLRRRLTRSGQGGVEVLPVAVTDRSGTVRFEVCRDHPGDHRIGSAGVEVAALTIDAILAERHWPSVCLIKIDVQGAEETVIAGACQTLERFTPALFIEVDEAALQRSGGCANSLLARLEALGYLSHGPLDSRDFRPRSRQEAMSDLQSAPGGYCDFIFLNPSRPPQSAPSLAS